jgi:hypothetical protein
MCRVVAGLTKDDAVVDIGGSRKLDVSHMMSLGALTEFVTFPARIPKTEY